MRLYFQRPSSMYIPMPARRLEDRIREMCARLLYEDEPGWSTTAQELQLALSEHILRLANITTALVVAGTAAQERRKS